MFAFMDPLLLEDNIQLNSLMAIRVRAGTKNLALVLFGWVRTHGGNTIWANRLIFSHPTYMGTVSDIRSRKKDDIVGTSN
jgi:hypothetical protein